ncbi:MAG: metallophosphoesterase [Clostridia bacterium]|nr:metallophosphoesterase [Clostridia bacterium]
MIFGIIFIVLLYGGANYYIFTRVARLMQYIFPTLGKGVPAAAYFAVAAVTLLAFIPMYGRVGAAVKWFGMHWMGLFVYLLLFFLLADLFLLVARIFVSAANTVAVLRFFALLISLLMALGTTGYGLYNGERLETVQYELKVEGIDGLRIVMLSDLHIGSVASERRLVGVVEAVNALSPDLVCIAGDLFDSNISSVADPQGVADLLGSIKASYGVYACLGNHDGGDTLKDMVALIEKSGVVLLNEDYRVIDGRFVIVGRLDSSPIGGYGDMRRGDTAALMDKAGESGLPVIAMDHNPARLEEYSGKDTLILSGHTHKGQIFPANLITKAMYTVHYGYYRADDTSPQTVVSCGAGTWGMPMRIGSVREVVCIDLKGN